MKKLFGSYFPWMGSINNSPAMNTGEFALRATAGLVKLWRLSLAVLLGAVLLGFSAPVMGQAVNATLLGAVTDTSGAVVAGAKVTATEMKTGVSRSTTTNDSGNYAFANLPPGLYEVATEKQGFKRAVRSGVDVVVNTDTRVNLALDAGAITESVVVTAETPILQTDRADVGAKIDSKQVVDLPLGNNRNFQNLLNLVPGATRAHRVHSEFFNAQDSANLHPTG